MHLSFSVPNPLARLTGLLDAVERSRTATAAEPEAHDKHVDPADMLPGSDPTDRNDDLDCLSLSRCEDSLDPGSHDLEAMSLSRVQRPGNGHDNKA